MAEDLAQGMAKDLVAPLWPAMTDDEIRDVLSCYTRKIDTSVRPLVLWRSPRPMSTAALVDLAGTTLFLKRHHVSVRTSERLRVEHDLTNHLLDKGCPLPAVLRTLDGDSVVRGGDYIFEVQEQALGEDLYRDVPSWYPFAARAHAVSAGRALANFHCASHGFPLPATPPGVLTNSTQLVTSLNPLDELERLLESRPDLLHAIGTRAVRHDVDHYLRPSIERAAPLLNACSPQWGHGDWHASNLTWSSRESDAVVVAVIDLSLANRTFVIHDLAIAIERSCVDWLDVAGLGHIVADLDVVDALLDGYEELRPLDSHEWATLIAVLPVVHVEFALSEVEYFDRVAHQPHNVDLAYDDFLLGHTRWFKSRFGEDLLNRLRRRAEL
ncbi:MAG TPA: phosphotransferase [Acidimicrobiales bacterium]